MIGVSFGRVLRSAFLNFWRNIWLSLAMAAIMTITLLMIVFLYFANVFGSELIKTIEQKVDLSVTFKENVQQQYIEAIAAELSAREDVSRVSIMTSEQALEDFRRRHSEDQLVEESLKELGDNPLPAAMYVVATEPRFYENISKQLQADKYSPFIDQVNFENSRHIIDRLIALMASVKNVAAGVTATFALLVILITFNTVRLAIYSFREEIDIMRLVGASAWFIQGPFIVETVLVALVAVTLSSVALYPALRAAAPHLQQFFFGSQAQPFDVYTYATEHWLTIVGLQIGVAVALAVFSSLIAIRRYLKD